MKGSTARRNRNRNYRYHWDYGHDTEECFEPKEEIEILICRGQLRHNIARPNQPTKRPPP